MVHAIHLCHPVTMSSIAMPASHHANPSPYHPFTLPSIHTFHVIHSPCHPVRIMAHAIHLPCSPFTVSASHHDIQALSHNFTPRWRDLRSLTRKISSSCLRSPWRGAPAPWGRSSSPFFPSSSPPPCTLQPSPIPLLITIFPTAGAAKTYLNWRPLNIGSNMVMVMVETILVFNLLNILPLYFIL